MARVILFCCLLLNCLGVHLLAEPIPIGLNYPHSGNYRADVDRLGQQGHTEAVE